MAVFIPTDSQARSDDFIDDVVRVFLDSLKARAREPHVVPLLDLLDLLLNLHQCTLIECCRLLQFVPWRLHFFSG